MTTLNTLVKRCAGLLDTRALTAWENSFVARMQEITRQGDDTRPLTGAQIDVLERIFQQHFGDH